MEVISGSPPAEYGDKTSLVINASTRSGLGQKPTGSLTANYGSFGTIGEEATLDSRRRSLGQLSGGEHGTDGALSRYTGALADA